MTRIRRQSASEKTGEVASSVWNRNKPLPVLALHQTRPAAANQVIGSAKTLPTSVFHESTKARKEKNRGKRGYEEKRAARNV